MSLCWQREPRAVVGATVDRLALAVLEDGCVDSSTHTTTIVGPAVTEIKVAEAARGLDRKRVGWFDQNRNVIESRERERERDIDEHLY